jgi:hypothetical protein
VIEITPTAMLRFQQRIAATQASNAITQWAGSWLVTIG